MIIDLQYQLCTFIFDGVYISVQLAISRHSRCIRHSIQHSAALLHHLNARNGANKVSWVITVLLKNFPNLKRCILIFYSPITEIEKKRIIFLVLWRWMRAHACARAKLEYLANLCQLNVCTPPKKHSHFWWRAWVVRSRFFTQN